MCVHERERMREMEREGERGETGNVVLKRYIIMKFKGQ